MMIGASLYITLCSAKNRILQRLRRLREPRYLIGAVVGAAYIYFSFFARLRGRNAVGRRPRSVGVGPPVSPEEFARIGPAIGALALFIVACLAWLLPMNSGMLEFSDAEVEVLFTAPVSRRSLILHRLMRSQLGLLFTAVVTSIFYPGAAAGRVQWALAMWIVLATSRVYFTGVTLARGRLTGALSQKSAVRGAVWAPVVVSVVALIAVGQVLVRDFYQTPPAAFADAVSRLGAMYSSGPTAILLWPFLALVRPLAAQGIWNFLALLLQALAVLVVTTVWVMQTDHALQDVAESASQQRATKATAASPSIRARGGLALAPVGRPETVFLWKNGTSMIRATSGLALFRYFVPLIALSVMISTAIMSARDAHGLAATLCTIAIGVAAFAAVLGPQVVRTDLRSDLRHLEILKTWPVRPAAVVRGEMLCPAVVLTSVIWLAILCAGILSAAGFPQMPVSLRVISAAAAAVLAPAFVGAQLTVQNAAAVFFPAWVPQGDQRPRGLDAMGQRLIMLAGVLLSVIVMFLPGAIAAGILWFALYRFLGAAIAPVAAIVCTAIVGIEVLAATELLGPAYERLDILSVERAE
ncbi:MAG TPA: putative ABC exporter domain-containing protein [Vicinamibacterales bacterium]|nr:putative ABC exporter domain-containing protein [Vicinamibacterales bacterium]